MSDPTPNESLVQINQPAINHETAVAERYSQAANEREPALCCPVSYRQDLLEVIPEEIIARDYGCGDPSPFVNPGETVVDLGSGGGKLCYIAAQVVGESGKVIGVDCNADMLKLARKYQPEIATKLGFENVEFRCGVIQNLALDLELLDRELSQLSSQGVANILDRRRLEQRLADERPMIPDNSVDCVISNCVLNLVRPVDRIQLFSEIFRVLKPGGRAAISDVVSDEDVPEEMQNNPELWSGCISGAWREDLFLEEFAEAGFYGMEIAKRQQEPWQTVEGIEFRSVTVLAYKPDDRVCLDLNQAVIYKGPFDQVIDEEGNIYPRGQRVAVCGRTFDQLMAQPYADHFLPVEPLAAVSPDEAEVFDCDTQRLRLPQETKGEGYQATSSCCGDSGCC